MVHETVVIHQVLVKVDDEMREELDLIEHNEVLEEAKKHKKV